MSEAHHEMRIGQIEAERSSFKESSFQLPLLKEGFTNTHASENSPAKAIGTGNQGGL